MAPTIENSQLRKSVLDGEMDRGKEYARGQGDDGLQAAQKALEASLDKKAIEPVMLDMHDMCSYTNYIVIVSGRSDRQVGAIADNVRKELREGGWQLLGSEGHSSGQWALLDYGDLIVHVFHHPAREHYNLESLWTEAPRVAIEIPEEARASHEDGYTV